MRIVIKVGTSTLAHSTGCLNIRHVEELCKVISDLKNFGHEIILVSSGAIGMGAGKLSLGEKPSDMPTKQAAAAVGQCELMYTYDKLFSEHNHTVAQLLITEPDMSNDYRHTNFRNTVIRLLELGVATEEISVGDNDTLSALVTVSVNADLLILLSDIDGLYTADPHKNKNAKLIPCVHEVTAALYDLAGSAGTKLGTGGMETKLRAAEICLKSGIDMIIANGATPSLLYDITDGKSVGTLFTLKEESK